MDQDAIRRRISELTRALVDEKKHVAQIIGVWKDALARRRAAVQEVHAAGLRAIERARAGDFEAADIAYRERAAHLAGFQRVDEEARERRAQRDAAFVDLRARADTIEALKCEIDLLVCSPRDGFLPAGRPAPPRLSEQALPPPAVAPEDEAAAALERDNERLTALVEEHGSWPAVIARLEGR